MDFNKNIQNIDFPNQTIHLIYRVCDQVNVCSASNRCFSVSKQQLIFKCLDSIKNNLQNIDKRVTLNVYIVLDGCVEDTIQYLAKTFKTCKNVVFYNLNKKSNALSFCFCVKLASEITNDNDIVFLLEDDYLFLQDNVFSKVAVGMYQLKQQMNSYVGIMPDDYPDRYTNDVINTQINITDVGHFAKIDSTTCTFITHAGAIKQNLQACMNFIHWPFVSEAQSVNLMWKNIPLFQPMPAFTLHSQLLSIIPKYLDFNKLDSYFKG